MHINDMFPSKYLRAGDLKGKRVKLTIRDITIEEFDDGRKPALHFERTDKMLSLNKTNALIIADMYGPETSGWIGREIFIQSERVTFQGKMHDAIRVHLSSPAEVESQAPLPPRREPPPAAEVAPMNGSYAAAKEGAVSLPSSKRVGGIDDEIPF